VSAVSLNELNIHCGRRRRFGLAGGSFISPESSGDGVRSETTLPLDEARCSSKKNNNEGNNEETEDELPPSDTS